MFHVYFCLGSVLTQKATEIWANKQEVPRFSGGWSCSCLQVLREAGMVTGLVSHLQV